MAEELGFDSVWLFDHFMALYGDPDGPCLETSTLLSALAVKTSRVKIGVLVYGNTHRHPAILAKEIVTVDHVSMGRAILGIGAGWNAREHAAYSIPFPSPGDRVEMLDESLQIMQSLFTERRTTFQGQHYRLDDAPFNPKPLQEKLPVLIGGERPKMLRVVARHADFWDTAGLPRHPAGPGRHCRPLPGDWALSRCHSGIDVVLRGRQARRCAGLCRARTNVSCGRHQPVSLRFPDQRRGAGRGQARGDRPDSALH